MARLTNRQVVELYFHARDDQGNLTDDDFEELPEEVSPERAEAMMKTLMRVFGQDADGKPIREKEKARG